MIQKNELQPKEIIQAHLLHAALKKVLGDHVQQQGSAVGPTRLRFDFTHHQGVSGPQLEEIESMVYEQILQNNQVVTELMELEAAKASGAEALFGEKYEEKVRVLTMGEFSKELCGGTHVSATGDIGAFRITAESSIAAGIRRVEAVTGFEAMTQARQDRELVQSLAGVLKVKRDDLDQKVIELNTQYRSALKELATLKTEKTNSLLKEIVQTKKTDIEGIPCVVDTLEAGSLEKSQLQKVLDKMHDLLPSGVAVLLYPDPSTDSLTVLVSSGPETVAKGIKAGALAGALAALGGGKGGGRPEKQERGSKAFKMHRPFLVACLKLSNSF